MNSSVPRDINEFLGNYPNNEDDESASANLLFYSNELRCRPDNALITEIHERWFGDYRKLEWHHGFIQWLFPIQEYGMNYESQPLQRHEITAMQADDGILARVVQSYKLMLDFYGIHLVSEETGLLQRVKPDRKCAERYRNLVRSSHNNLRISRILKCLAELGLERLNAGFILHVLNEQSEHGNLNTSMIRGSMDRWWANCIRNEDERGWIGSTINKVRTDGEYIFTRGMYEEALDRRQQTGSLIGESEGGGGGGEKEEEAEVWEDAGAVEVEAAGEDVEGEGEEGGEAGGQGEGEDEGEEGGSGGEGEEATGEGGEVEEVE